MIMTFLRVSARKLMQLRHTKKRLNGKSVLKQHSLFVKEVPDCQGSIRLR